MPETLTVAVCLCEGVTLTDFIPPVETLGALNFTDTALFPQFAESPYRLKFDYLAPTMGPVASLTPGSPTVNPTKTYADASATQYDIIWVPAGPLPDPVSGADRSPQAEVDFIKQQAPGAKYVMSVCLGSFILARAGVLEGKRATTNKSCYKIVEAATTDKNIKWIASARWVVDGKFWTSSGVAAGADMALSFLEHLAGPKFAEFVRGIVEVPVHGPEDDPFAVFHGLV